MEEQVRPLYHVVDLEYLRELYFGLLFGSGQGKGARHIVLLLLLCSSSCVDYANDGLIKIHLFSPSTGITQCVNTQGGEEDGKRCLNSCFHWLCYTVCCLHSGARLALLSHSVRAVVFPCCLVPLCPATCALKWPSVPRLERHKGDGIAGSFQFIRY